MIRHRYGPVLGAPFYLLAALAIVFAGAGSAFALPQNPTIAGISSGGTNPTFNTSGSSLTVTQNSTRAVIDWTSFGIASGESVTFAQPSKSAIAFNVVTGGGMTNISGSLSANGGVWLFSPAGIIFGSGAVVNTGSFLASTGIFNGTSQSQALNGNLIQIFAQGTPGQGSITVDAASGSVPAASINAGAGFVLLHSPTITQAGDVTASDAVVYNADEDIGNGVTILPDPGGVSPTTGGVALVDEESLSYAPSASHIDHTGTTIAGTWFEVDAAEDVTTDPGFGGIINLGGHVTASGMKATGNPDNDGDGFSVILDGDHADYTNAAGQNEDTEVTTIDASTSTITAAQGIYATGGLIKTGLWTNNGGAVNISGGGAGVEVDQPLVSTGSGFVEITGDQNLAVDADVTAGGSALLGSHQIQVGPNVTIQAGASVPGSVLSMGSVGSLIVDPTSTLLVGPSLAAPNGALDMSAGGTIDVNEFPGLNLSQTLVGQGGDLTLGTAVAGSMALQATGVNNVGGAINIPGSISAPGEISLDATGPANVAGSITSAGSVFIAASELDLGQNGGVMAGYTGSGPAPAGTLSAGLGSANLTLQNSAGSGLVPTAQAPAAGDIVLGAPVNWAFGNNFFLDAYHSVVVSAPVVDSGGGYVFLNTNQGGTGGDYSFVNGGSLSFTNTPGSGQGIAINGVGYDMVYSVQDLTNINYNLGGNYALAGPLDFFPPGDSTLTAFAAAPVASLVSQPFTGTFTGLGNTISNLTILDTTPVTQTTPERYATNGDVGLFGAVGPSGVVRDVNLAQANVQGTNGMSVGALVGANEGTVKDSSSSGFVIAGSGVTTSQGYADAGAGGLVGVSDGKIVNSSSSATVVAGDGFAGGLVATAYQGGSITGSSASGSVIVGSYSGNTADPVPDAGGLVGLIYGYQFGGVNPIQVNVSNSFATGAVSGGSGTQVGGFAGVVDQGQVTTSYATGSVTQTAAPVIFSATNLPSNLIGGFAGVVFTGGSVTQSWASGAVTTVGPSAAPSPTTPGAFAGGFVGDMDQGGSVSDSYSLGAVTGTGGAGSIDGGFVGIIQGAATANTVYATGLVSSTGLAAGLAAILGNSTDTPTTGFLSNSFWDEGTTNQTVGYNLGGAGTATNVVGIGGTTGISPYAATSYVGWDFTNTWFLIPGETRPILRSEYSTTITDAHQLQLMALVPTADYTLANNINASETSSASGVWNSVSGFVPVGGNGNANFTGTLNGAGHTISNLFIDESTIVSQTGPAGFPNNGYAGLFGIVGAGGVVQDINLANANVTGANEMVVGALAGSDQGAVDHATSSGFVATGATDTTTNPISFAVAGGLLGDVGLGGTLSNSSSSAIVAAGVNGSIAGGLVGSLVSGGSISNAFATGSVSVAASTTTTDGEAGGLAGAVYGYSSPNDVGPDPVSITGSYATGAVSAGAESAIGGFAGVVTNGQLTIDYATGTVTQTASGNMGGNFAGGFAGFIDLNSVVSQSYASGAVSIVGGTDNSHYAFGGGFAGDVDTSASVADSYSLSSVTATGSNFSIIGGFAGVLLNSFSVPSGATIVGVYATGATAGPGLVGGLVGLTGTGTFISNSYWDQATTGQTTGVDSAAPGSVATGPAAPAAVGGSGPSAYQQASYPNLFSTDFWVMIEGETRPVLMSEYSTNITNAHQLQLMELNLGGDYTLANDINASETTADPAGVWNPANGFVPVGGILPPGSPAEGPFSGDLLGEGHSITGLTIVDTTATPALAGGTPTNGAVGLFGFVSGGQIEGVNVIGATVTGGAGMSVGALVGNLESGVVSSDASSGTVTVGSGVSTVGGFANASAGGLVGYASGSISLSSSSATVIGGQANVGGLVGELQGDVETSHATGNVSVAAYTGSGQNPVVGGFVGSADAISTISGSYATGNVTAGGGSVAGGFAGASHGTISESYATGNVTQAASQYSIFQNEAGGFAGGVAGGQVSQSFASGAVNETGSPTVPSQVGGFAGELDLGSVTNAYSTGPVSVSGSTFDYAGGFIGAILAGSVTNVYATGAVSASGDPAGLVGNNGGSITNGYWDEGTTGQGAVGYHVAGGSETNVVGIGGSTGISPFVQSTYAGFDFTNIWSVPSAPNFYPELYGASHVLNVTAEDSSTVYGTFPVYTLALNGLQGGDNFVEPSSNPFGNFIAFGPTGETTSTSGFYNVGSITLGLPAGSQVAGSSGAYRLILDPGTLTVTPKPISGVLSGTVEKTYDGTNSATLAPGNFALSGVVLDDKVSLTGPDSATYDTKNAGTGKTVTVNGVALSGADEADYTLTDASASGPVGTIDPKALTLSAVADTMVYDGGVLAAGATPTEVGLVSGDTISNLSESFASKNAGSETLSVNPGYTLSDGDNGGNYTVSTTTAQGTITPAPLTLEAVGDTMTYNGGVLATGVTPEAVGLQPGDSVANLSESFAGKDAGPEALSVNPGYTVSDGNNGGNYTVTQTSAQGTIDPKPLTAGLTGSIDKTFDGNADATLTADNYTLTGGVVSGDNVSLNEPTNGTYDNANPGTDKVVSVSGLALSGADANNYIVNGTASAPIGTINEAPQPIVIVSPVTVVDASDFTDTATAAAAAATAVASSSSSGAGKTTTTVVNVFPVAPGDPDQTAQGDTSPITGAGNRDLWTGTDESACPPGAAPTAACPASAATKP